jgi:hypothetical protein
VTDEDDVADLLGQSNLLEWGGIVVSWNGPEPVW